LQDTSASAAAVSTVPGEAGQLRCWACAGVLSRKPYWSASARAGSSAPGPRCAARWCRSGWRLAFSSL